MWSKKLGAMGEVVADSRTDVIEGRRTPRKSKYSVYRAYGSCTEWNAKKSERTLEARMEGRERRKRYHSRKHAR